MKQKLILSTLLVGLSASLFAQSLTYKPLQPKRGEKVEFTYNPASTPLATEANIEAVVYSFNNTGIVANDVKLTKVGAVYAGSFVVDTGARLNVFAFRAGKKRDPNSNKGYLLPAYENGKPVFGVGLSTVTIHDGGFGKAFFDLEAQPDVSWAALEKEWNDYPERRNDLFLSYLAGLNRMKKKEAEPEIKAMLDKRIAEGNVPENMYTGLASWYTRLKDKEKSDAVLAEMKQKFPEGMWKKSEAIAAFNKLKEPEEKEAAYKAIMATYPPKTDQEKAVANNLRTNLARAYADATKPKQDIAKFKELTADLTIAEKAGLYNDISWQLTQKDLEIPFSAAISKEATDWAKQQISNPTGKKPALSTAAEWATNRKSTYAMYADTYSYIMYKTKDYKTGVQYAREATDIRERKDAEYNERYATLLEKTATPDQVAREIEPMVKDGVAGKEAKAVLRRALVTSMKSEEKADAYMVSLGAASAEKAQMEMIKTMLNEEAPTFKLRNIDGMEVSLASLKGKVVVLDFWATWCGPCKASFPGMQRALDKYKNNTNVVFLFIDTWERQETHDLRKKEVTAFINDNKYSFNVLYDDPKKDDPNAFVVVNNYKVEGIPTKFIIGKDGKIKFKSVGYSGNEDKLVEEISSMIEVAGKTD